MPVAALLLAETVTTDPTTTAAATGSDTTGLLEACGTTPSWLCEGIWNLSHNRFLTKTLDWLITVPIVSLIVVIVAALLARWGRRGVTAVITRITTPPAVAVGALEKIGVLGDPDPRHATRTRTLCAVARTTVSAFIWTIATLIVLGLFHINLAPLIAGAGVAGIAIGLGAQSLVRDCIAGFFILLEDQCGVGDQVDLAVVSGTVEALTLRATTIRALDGTLWSVPNGTIQRVGNQSRTWGQANVDVHLARDADLAEAVRVAAAAAQEAARPDDIASVLLREPEVLGLEQLDTNGSVLRLTVRTKPGQQARVARTVRLAVRAALDDAGVERAPD